MKLQLVILVLVVFGFAASALADSETRKRQTHCPICSMEIDKRLFVDHEGKRIYFGCDSCPDLFRKSPKKYLRQLNAAGIVLADTPANSTARGVQLFCVCGNDHLDESLFTDVSGKRVFFCKRKCSEHFNKSPENNLKKVKAKGIDFQDVPVKEETD